MKLPIWIASREELQFPMVLFDTVYFPLFIGCVLVDFPICDDENMEDLAFQVFLAILIESSSSSSL